MADREVKIQDPFARLRELHLRALTFLSTDWDANVAKLSDVRQEWLENHYYPALIAGKLSTADVESGASDIVMDQISAILQREADGVSSPSEQYRKKRLSALLDDIQQCLDDPNFIPTLNAMHARQQYPSFDQLRDQKAEDLDELSPAFRQFLNQHEWNTGLNANRLVQAYEAFSEQMQENGTVLDDRGTKHIDVRGYKPYSRMLVQSFLDAAPYTTKHEAIAQQLVALTMDAQLQTVLDEIPEADRTYIAKETGMNLRDIAFRLHELHHANAEAVIHGDAVHYQGWNEFFPDTPMGTTQNVLKERVLKQFAQRLDEASLLNDTGRNWREELTEIGYTVAKATVKEKEGVNHRLSQENAELKARIEALERANTGMGHATRYLQNKQQHQGDGPPLP